jgi:predicted DCC family thiol-disulfide oxidoreductase YuxK
MLSRVAVKRAILSRRSYRHPSVRMLRDAGTRQFSSDTELVAELKSHQPIVIYDGVCNLCNSTVNFVMDHDPTQRFKFLQNQSPKTQMLLEQFDTKGIVPSDSVMLFQNDQIYVQSEAALRIGTQLSQPWSILAYSAQIIPKFIRDRVYHFVGQRRYKWFGKTESCRVPTPDIRSRFIQ